MGKPVKDLGANWLFSIDAQIKKLEV